MSDTAEHIGVILRHGKAERDSETGMDADRKLAERGRLQAAWLGEQLAKLAMKGVAVISSPAARAWTTAAIVADSLGTQVIEEPRLFTNAGVSDVLAVLAEQKGHCVVVGHNPTFSLAASMLVGGFGSRAVSLRTGEAALCRFTGSIEPGACRSHELLRFDHH